MSNIDLLILKKESSKKLGAYLLLLLLVLKNGLNPMKKSSSPKKLSTNGLIALLLDLGLSTVFKAFFGVYETYFFSEFVMLFITFLNGFSATILSIYLGSKAFLIIFSPFF